MKRLYFAFLTFISLGIVACGGSGGGENTPTSTGSPAVETPDTPDTETPTENKQPNILLIISDDQGLDASAQYSFSDDLPHTPTLNVLANNGLVFDNAWATPSCTTTRATIITGKYGINSGVTYTPAVLSDEHQSIQSYLAENPNTENYSSAVFGKWHLGGGGNNSELAEHPATMGIHHFAGNLGNIDDYYNWELTVNGETQTSDEYHTSKITDLAIEWIAEQNSPWFAWLAYSAPHSPFHLPPSDLHERTLSGDSTDINDNRRAYYLAAIEAMDTEIGRLLDTLDEQARENTLIIYIGDNGTPSRIIDTSSFASDHGKGSLYQGGIAVPLIVSGAGVDRINEREDALVTATDLFATLAQAAGADRSTIHDSLSFYNLLSDNTSTTANQIFTEFESASVTGIAVRNSTHKLIQLNDGSEAFYALTENFSEQDNLINNAQYSAQIEQLREYASSINGNTLNKAIDITNAILTNGSGNCADYIAQYTSTVNDVGRDAVFMGDLEITLDNNKCIFTTNAIPNHDFNDGGNAFPNNVSEQNDRFEITISPQKSTTPTALSLSIDNAILLNGVKVDLLAAGCFGVGDGKIGCNDMSTPWRYDPMHPESGFRVDSHNAHAQPDGTYHYHGSPFALFADNSNEVSPVIGFAADGFPIYGSYIEDNGQIRKVQSSYRLKSGTRPNGEGEPGGNYNGLFRDDYEYLEGAGDLDACNGMTVDGVYAYYITDDYPYVLACFTGEPDLSFYK
ncbi:YHYH protein [Agaribacter flavus]|uniref:YHYH protein n=1 Tax=Agaribacter flavus TaxID=1902781 RepID=A0ABV7FTQ9_9ALTE